MMLAARGTLHRGMDALIVGWGAKYRVLFWRPETAREERITGGIFRVCGER
jgi:hypothetical protein